jgi:thiol-disulfide isomerase/thioredoxin
MKNKSNYQHLKILPLLLIIPLIYHFSQKLSDSNDSPNFPLLNKAAPDFTIGDFALHTLQGKPIFLHFWASWCGPCVTEMPQLLALQKKQPDLQIIALSEDNDWAAVETFFRAHPDLAEFRRNVRILLDDKEQVAQRYKTQAFPETFLINQHFLVDNKFVGPQNWISKEMEIYLGRLSK